MGFNESMFILAFIGVILITILKFKNIMTIGTYYDMKNGIILFVINTICWFVTFIGVMVEPTKPMIISLSMLCTMLFALNFLFMIIEIILKIAYGVKDMDLAQGPRLGRMEYERTQRS